MTSAILTHDPSAQPAEPPRLSLKPLSATPVGYVDGAWWPRSDDLAAELPPLLAALTERLGHVERVSYHLGDWTAVPRRIGSGDRTVHLGGYRLQGAGTVDVSGTTRGVTLLVVPPGTDRAAAERALAAAGRPDDTERVAALLQGTGRDENTAAAEPGGGAAAGTR
jgi:hypothetical protein